MLRQHLLLVALVIGSGQLTAAQWQKPVPSLQPKKSPPPRAVEPIQNNALAHDPLPVPEAAASIPEPPPPGEDALLPANSLSPESERSGTPAMLNSRVTLERIDAKHLGALILKSKAPMTLVHFWATGCESCLNVIPDLMKLQAKWGPKVQVLQVALNTPLETAGVRRTLHKVGYQGKAYIRSQYSPPLGEAFQSEWDGATPALLAFKRGKIDKSWLRPSQGAWLDQAVGTSLAAK